MQENVYMLCFCHTHHCCHLFTLPVSSRPRPPFVKPSLLLLVSSHMPEQVPPTITAALGAWLREVTV